MLEKYHRAEFIGLENIPDGPFLGVGNHTGMHFMPEAFLWMCKYHADPEHRPMYTLVHEFIYKTADRLGLPLHAFGILEAERGSAHEALRQGCAVTVYPGGDRDNARAFTDRNRIDFFGHRGYVQLALRTGAPILPIVGVGGGEAVFTLTSGERFAELMGLKRFFQVHTWPVYWSFPFGWRIGHLPRFELPLPTQVTISVLPAISTEGYPDHAAGDPEVVEELDRRVTALMQAEMDRLTEGRIPLIGGRKNKK